MVRRASHTQYVPQVTLPHSEPVTSVIAMKSTPISAEAPAMRSHASERVRFQR